MKNTFAADIVETLLLACPDRALGFAQLETLISQLDGDNQFRLDIALNHMRMRMAILENLYPFEVLPYAVKKAPNCEEFAYTALLALSPAGLIRNFLDVRGIARAAIVFEEIVDIAVKGLAGRGGQSTRFGWPSSVGRPQEFPEAIAWIGTLMGVHLGRGFRPPRRKDGGVDIIAWRKFRDGKSAFPIFLIQCTIQSDLKKKAEDIDLRNWAYWLDFARDPVPVLAVPHEVSGVDEDWKEISLKSLVIDRLRIVELLDDAATFNHNFIASDWQIETLSKLRDWMEGE